jgi:hypothetical protein
VKTSAQSFHEKFNAIAAENNLIGMSMAMSSVTIPDIVIAWPYTNIYPHAETTYLESE